MVLVLLLVLVGPTLSSLCSVGAWVPPPPPPPHITTTTFLQQVPLWRSSSADQSTTRPSRRITTQQLLLAKIPTTTAKNSLSSSRTTQTPATCTRRTAAAFLVSSTLVSAAALVVVVQRPPLAYADEIGIEQDAPTLFTGETVEICTKRGPLGACVQTERRTQQNDNDKAAKYFSQKSIPLPTEPALIVVNEEETRRSSQNRRPAAGAGVLLPDPDDVDNTNSNSLIQKLRQQSIDNQERNALAVERQTFENNQAASFGPFDRQVLVMNTDGRTFTLLENPVAMRLKQAGFINDRRIFIKQPTADDLARAEQDAAAAAGGVGGLFQSLFGS